MFGRTFSFGHSSRTQQIRSREIRIALRVVIPNTTTKKLGEKKTKKVAMNKMLMKDMEKI